jgi:hypothetical protein
MSIFMMGGLKLKREVRHLGRITSENMYGEKERGWLLPRINPLCENFGKNTYHNVDVTYTKPFIVLPWGMANKVYRIVCPECGETIELDVEEYAVLKPWLQ